MNIINIQIVFFGALKSHFGSHLQMSVPKGMALGQLVEILAEKAPAASEILTSCRIAVDSALEKENFTLRKSHEIAILPPFSGG
jgi:molybdopterin converting factor small subunit